MLSPLCNKALTDVWHPVDNAIGIASEVAMARRVSLPKVDFIKASGAGRLARQRRISYDVLTPAGAPPVVRIRICTPITPRAVRAQLLDAANDLPESVRGTFVQKRLTALDRMLTDEEAAALETWAHLEADMARAKTCDLAGDRVQTSRSNIVPLSITRDHALARRAWVWRRLSQVERSGLTLFVRQMSGERDAPSAEAAGMWLRGVTGKTARAAWHEFVVAMGKTLRELFVDFERMRKVA